MIAPIMYRPAFQVDPNESPNDPSGLSRVFAAAIVDRQFCELLLRDPREALQKGYLGEVFSLSKQELDLIVSIRAESLSDLARQVNRSIRVEY